jgi:hypothetical protein
MNGKHWSDDELLDRVYGVGPEDDHLNVCAECEQRWLALSASREALVSRTSVESANLTPAQLLRQREAVMARIERSSGFLLPWRAVVAFAGAAAMMVGFIVYHPEHSKPVTVQTASSDAQFFSEIYSEVEQMEPRAVKPMRRLFQEQQ